MGVSSKKAAGDGLNWSQGVFEEGEVEMAMGPPPPPAAAVVAALRCPRCDSYNTKFCYYNNYSRSQPRHFCKSCRRHWTNGGTLRNVPVGGGRKNKRPKTWHASSSTTADDGPRQQQRQPPHLPATSPSFVPDHLRPPTSPSSSDYFTTTTTAAAADLGYGNGSRMLGRLPSLPPMPPPAMTADPFYPSSSYAFLPLLMRHVKDAAAASEGRRQDHHNAVPTFTNTVVDVGTHDGGLFQATTLSPTCGFPETSSAGGGYWNCWDELAGAGLGTPPAPTTASGLPDLGLI